jgi:hypothetical protein
MFVVDDGLLLDLAKYYGSDATPSSLKNAFNRQVRPAIKLLTECYGSGGDAKDLGIEHVLIGGSNGSLSIFLVFAHCALHNFLLSDDPGAGY